MASSSTFTNLKSFTSIISKYGLSNLEKTLKCGNTTGGNNIVLSAGDSIKGQTQIVLTEAPAPSTSSTEGALFVSDGSSGNGNKNQLYYREAVNGNKLNLMPTQYGYLHYNDITFTEEDISFCQYNETKTQNNGNIISYINSDGLISFSGISNCLLEFYVHADVDPNPANLTNNFVIFDLSGISTETNTLSTIDIDTRSISKNTTAHLTFGPTIYKLIDTSDVSVDKNLCISNANTYKLRVEVGKEHTLTEIKLIIKVVYT